MEDKGERLAQAINYLKKTGQIKNLDDVAEIVDRSKNNISSAINGDKRYLSDKFLKHFNNSFRRQFSLEWLIRGIGDMFCPTASDEAIFGSSSDSANGLTTDSQRTHNGGTSDDALAMENAMLKKLLEEKDRTIEEKERTIQILLGKQ